MLRPVKRRGNDPRGLFARRNVPRKGIREMNELDFSGKQVLVIGGSSGIGNGIAQSFRGHGAHVAVCGTRASAADYAAAGGSAPDGLDYAQLDVSKTSAIEIFAPPFERLDILVLAQGAVLYRRGEFAMD